MSREDILEILDQHEKKGDRRRGMSWGDRLIGALLIYLLHAFVPTPEHGIIGGLAADVKVMNADFKHTSDQVADHETRIRVLEKTR